MTNLPSKSVCVPDFVPLTNILTPGIGNPALSETVPETDLSCANVNCAISTTKSTKSPLNFSLIIYMF